MHPNFEQGIKCFKNEILNLMPIIKNTTGVMHQAMNSWLVPD